MIYYEYYTYVYDTTGFRGGKVSAEALSRELTCIGMQGWELVSTTTTQQGNGQTRSIVFVFRREAHS